MTDTTDNTREPKLLGTIWLMQTKDGFYPIQPSERCKPEDHGNLNDHIMMISNIEGKSYGSDQFNE